MQFPEATITLDAPRKRSGEWFLDVNLDGHIVVVHWREKIGFGVSSSMEHGYGEGPDEVYRDDESTYRRVVMLLETRSFTTPPNLDSSRRVAH
jgi:hypothetical protein